MFLKKIIKKIYHAYVEKCIGNIEIPKFEEGEERRYRVVFSGCVQGVGFRYEVWLIAEKIGVTGFVENLENGKVLMEAQGNKNKVLYLIEHMKTISRITIDSVEIDEIELKKEEKFVAIY